MSIFEVVAFRESTWMDRKADYRQWDHLCRAYNAKCTLLERNAEIPDSSCLVIVDEQGETELLDFDHPKHCTYLFGHTHMNDLLSHKHDFSVRIATPQSLCLFGISAASIVLADRWRKHDC